MKRLRTWDSEDWGVITSIVFWKHMDICRTVNRCALYMCCCSVLRICRMTEWTSTFPCIMFTYSRQLCRLCSVDSVANVVGWRFHCVSVTLTVLQCVKCVSWLAASQVCCRWWLSIFFSSIESRSNIKLIEAQRTFSNSRKNMILTCTEKIMIQSNPATAKSVSDFQCFARMQIFGMNDSRLFNLWNISVDSFSILVFI
jgi:hypothetical protein